MCPEMIFCEQMPNDKSRFNGPPSGYENGIAYGCDPDATFYDSSFDLNRHNFLARGGETYYLHLLQVIENDKSRRTKLEKYLKNLLTDKSKQFSDLANWIQGKWESAKKLDHSKLIHRIPIGYIPVGAYTVSGNHAVDELITFLSNEMHPVKRVELLAKGVMYQILRMQLEQTAKYLNDKPYPLVLDMKSRKGGTIIRQLSVNSFNRVTDAFTSAINKCIVADRDGSKEPDLPAEYATYIKSKKESLDVFRSKGKELQCIIPSNGPFERFSLSEDVARFLVLSLVKPGARMDLDSFLKAMYEHFNIVIGPNEFVAYVRLTEWKNNGTKLIESIARFKDFLGADADTMKTTVEGRLSEINGRIEEINGCMTAVYDAFYSISSVDDINQISTAIKQIGTYGIPESDMEDFLEIDAALANVLQDIAVLMEEKNNRSRFNANYSALRQKYEEADMEFDVLSVLDGVAEGVKNELDRKDNIWSSKHLSQVPANVPAIHTWLQDTDVLPTYLSEDTITAYNDMHKKVEAKLSEAKVKDIVLRFKELSASEQTE